MTQSDFGVQTMSSGNTSDLQSFYSFLGQQLNTGEGLSTPEQLLKNWRARAEYEQTVADVRESIAEYEAGKGVPVEVAFANVRKKLGGHK